MKRLTLTILDRGILSEKSSLNINSESVALQSIKTRYVIIALLVISATAYLVYSRFYEAEKDDFDVARAEMVRYLREDKNITDGKVLEVMGRVPRHLYVCPWLIDVNIGEQNPVIDYPLPYKTLEEEAYSDHGLPIAEGQSISSPYVVALMTESLRLNGSEKVLEIGTGSGYQAAILAEMSDTVYTMEIREILAKSAEVRLKWLGYNNIHVRWADGYFGWEEHAPYDAIIITCAVNHVPPDLIRQLKEGGRLILPLGSTEYFQVLTLIEKIDGKLVVTYMAKVNFVPMVGEAIKTGG
jgi:protein-L-isoaspartate(D-aspartate) O-methyltransferase